MFTERIKNLKPYIVPEISEGEIKLDAQENPYDLPDGVRHKIMVRLNNLKFNRYPDPDYSSLRGLIAAYCGVESDNILIGNGSDELILSLLIACGGRDCMVVAPRPTFAMYEILSQLTSSKYSSVPLGEKFELPADEIIALNPQIVFIAYPNNPTGNCFSVKKIKKILEETDALVIIDEAYYEFSGETFTGDINKFENLAVLRTFSKAFSLAGIRSGYLVAGSDMVRELRKVQLPYNFSVINQAILEVVLREKEKVLVSVEKIKNSKCKLMKELSRIEGITAYPSLANFILMKIDKMNMVLSALKKRKIKVRKFSGQDMEEFLRVTVGTDEENKNFIEAIKEAGRR